jgi:high-affinity iron transporter
VIQTLLTGLREGLEAALVVGMIVAFIIRAGRRELLRWVWAGVGAAVVLSLGFAGVLTFTARELPGSAEAVFAGCTSIFAVGFVTWMVFWMRRHSRQMSNQVQGHVDSAISTGGRALATAAFLAVIREGLETALFLWPTVRAAGNGMAPVLGAFIGLGASVLLGMLIYRRSIKLNLHKFFTYTGVALIVVAAGVLAHALSEFQNIGWLPGGHAFAYDFSHRFTEEGWLGSLLKGTLSLTPEMTWLGAITYIGYLATTISLFLRHPKAVAARSTRPPANASTRAQTRV